ncbi:hypothetical protein BKA70DRAFT_1433937 [Coprinopsis sp. MPI-PUGE-AT-0042]|nr:hypothetical protein BKA70DRAFT_1433937 [Coprinopsis sp. MPI-PUGE-AT-0042]
MSYSERLLRPDMDGPPFTRILRALHHPLQPVQGRSVYVINEFESASDTHPVLSSRFCLKKGMGEQYRYLLCLEAGDRVVWRSPGSGVEDDRLLLVVDFEGYPNSEVTSKARNLPSPVYKLENIGLDASFDLYQECDCPGKRSGSDRDDEEFLVDRILDERPTDTDVLGTSREYRVRWKGWPPSSDSWIPMEFAEDLEAMDRWEMQPDASIRTKAVPRARED